MGARVIESKQPFINPPNNDMDIRYGKGLEEIIWNIFTITDAIFHFSVVSFLAILYKFILFLPLLLCITYLSGFVSSRNLDNWIMTETKVTDDNN